MTIQPFHLAFPVYDIQSTRKFYENILSCRIGRESERWIDFDLYGHQITAHLTESRESTPMCNSVDNKSVPSRHFGVILGWSQWDQLVSRLHTHQVEFYIAPYTRFEGEIGEQRTFFIQDPSQNFLEFKCFRDPGIVFQS
ncbi:MAG: VOC family protein [Pseudomonadota bacterium]